MHLLPLFIKPPQRLPINAPSTIKRSPQSHITHKNPSANNHSQATSSAYSPPSAPPKKPAQAFSTSAGAKVSDEPVLALQSAAAAVTRAINAPPLSNSSNALLVEVVVEEHALHLHTSLHHLRVAGPVVRAAVVTGVSLPKGVTCH